MKVNDPVSHSVSPVLGPDGTPVDDGDGLEHEQHYVAMLYGRLDERRADTARRLDSVLHDETVGTPQALTERDAAAAMYTDRLAALRAAEHGLAFGRLDTDTGERRYIGRLGLLDEENDYEPLLMDWRAPAAQPFYTATAASPEPAIGCTDETRSPASVSRPVPSSTRHLATRTTDPSVRGSKVSTSARTWRVGPFVGGVRVTTKLGKRRTSPAARVRVTPTERRSPQRPVGLGAMTFSARRTRMATSAP